MASRVLDILLQEKLVALSFYFLTVERCLLLAAAVPFVMMYAAAIICVYYNAILAYVLAYMYYSFFKVLPWSECDPEWANQFCYTESSGLVSAVGEDHVRSNTAPRRPRPVDLSTVLTSIAGDD